MAVNLKELREIGLWMRDAGVSRLKTADLEIEMGRPLAAKGERPQLTPAEIEAERRQHVDDIMFRSSSVRRIRSPKVAT